MRRVLVLATRPQHLAPGEAEAWVREEVRRLDASPLVQDVTLTWLSAVSERHAQPWDLLLELWLRDDAEARDCVAEPVCADLLLDLRLLGMRPVVLAAGERENAP